MFDVSDEDKKLLEEAFAKYGIEVPKKYDLDIDLFMTWGNFDRFWLQDHLGSGFTFGNFDLQKHYSIFKNEETLSESLKKHYEDEANRTISSVNYKLQKLIEETAKKASRIWYDLDNINAINHPYLEKNQIRGFGCKQFEDKLVLPMRDSAYKLWNLQYIDLDGNKSFLDNGKKRGCYFAIGKPQNKKIIVCTDFITGAKIHEKTGEAVAIVFDQDNIEPIKEVLSTKYPSYDIKVMIDDDIKEIAPSAGTNEAIDVSNKYNTDVCTPKSENSQEKYNSNNSTVEKETNVSDIDSKPIEEEQKQQIPTGYVLDDSGLYKKSDNKNDFKISDKIEVLAESRDDNSNNWGKVVRFKDPDNTIKTVVISYDQFGSNAKELEETLRSKGLRIYKFNELKQYLSDFVTSTRIRSVNKVGWYKSVFVFPDESIIGNSDEDIMYCGSIISNDFQSKGSLEDWRENVSLYCQSNSRLLLAVSTAFACTLLYVTDQEGGGLHFVGKSSTGKSTILRVACSVYGDKNFMKTWRATNNGLEGIASTRNDTLLVLDELGQVDPNIAFESIYTLSNGNGKIRSNKNGTVKDNNRWRCLFLSSGEKDLNDCANESRKTVKAGQTIRFLTIPAEPNNDSFGAFETVHDKETGKAFSEYLNSAVNEYHGTAAREFIQCVINDGFEKIANDFRNFLNDAEQKYLPAEADKQVKRAFNRFMLIAFAGEYATEHGITGWNKDESLNACVTCFDDWIKERGGVEDHEIQALLKQVRFYFEQYGDSRFLDMNGVNSYITNIAGRKSKDEEGTCYFVRRAVFEGEICKNFNFKQAIEILFKKGWLKSVDSEVKHFKDKSERIYILTPKIGSDEDIN